MKCMQMYVEINWRSFHLCKKRASSGKFNIDTSARLANAGVIASEKGQETIDSSAAIVLVATTLNPEGTGTPNGQHADAKQKATLNASGRRYLLGMRCVG